MQITIEIPDELAYQLEADRSALSRHILENLVVEAYKSERITSAEVSKSACSLSALYRSGS
jgi:Uncharacterised protein family (UPF0175)